MPHVHSQKRPCAECPFSRKCQSGGTGGSSPLTYIGQAFGPFWLPCHMRQDLTSEASRHDHSTPQCAGAAIFRTNVGVVINHPFIHRLPEDRDAVFATPAELLTHHSSLSPQMAAHFLKLHPPEELCAVELQVVRDKLSDSKVVGQN